MSGKFRDFANKKCMSKYGLEVEETSHIKACCDAMRSFDTSSQVMSLFRKSRTF